MSRREGSRPVAVGAGSSGNPDCGWTPTLPAQAGCAGVTTKGTAAPPNARRGGRAARHGGLESEPCATFASEGAGRCRVANKTIQIPLGRAVEGAARTGEGTARMDRPQAAFSNISTAPHRLHLACLHTCGCTWNERGVQCPHFESCADVEFLQGPNLRRETRVRPSIEEQEFPMRAFAS